MKKDLLRRLERLERRVRGDSLPWFHIAVTIRGLELGPGERIVEDWLSADEGVLITQERVTTDPDDEGNRCPCKLDPLRFSQLPPVFPTCESEN
jgi:hypothetical protein